MAHAFGGFGCHDNPSFMLTQCPHSCNTCHLLDEEKRCASLDEHPRALQAGSVNAMFTRLTRLALATEVLSSDPWLVLVRDLVREEEMELLLREHMWERASDTGPIGQDGRAEMVFSSRRDTDVNWCQKGCINEPAMQRLTARISELIAVHPRYFEIPQLLRYGPGQHYNRHHDASATRQRIGTRVYTVFIYLSSVEQGGETEFPFLNLKVKPERGAALIWPSVQDQDPSKIDERTQHAALPVIKGTKYSANVWVWLGPHKLAHELNCAASPLTHH